MLYLSISLTSYIHTVQIYPKCLITIKMLYTICSHSHWPHKDPLFFYFDT